MSREIGSEIVRIAGPDAVEKKEFTMDDYIDHFSSLVELERREEMERHEREIRNLSGGEREAKGRAILKARGRDAGTGLGGKSLVKFVRKDGLPETEIGVGDLVMVSRRDPLADDNPAGTAIEKTGYSLTAAFDRRPPKWAYKRVRLDLYVNDVTYQRMLDVLHALPRLKGRRRALADRLLSKGELDTTKDGDITLFNPSLNESQVKGVKDALAARYFHLIHGPPGTGKTITCVEIIQQEAENGKVMACADSNTAVDNLVEHLVSRGRTVVRLGHPARVTPVLRGHTLDYLLEDNPSYVKAQRLRARAYEIKEEQDRYTYPSGRWRRGFSNRAIKSLAAKGRGDRGVPAEKIREMARSIELQEEIDEIFERVSELEDRAVEEILDGTEVVCTTNSSAASEPLEGMNFDVCVIDEATQATEPSCLIPLIKAPKVILAGDHRQLPPTILNREANDNGLAATLFERLLALYGPGIKTLLRTQYRMHKEIMEFPNREFYQGEIKAAEGVRNHTLSDLINAGKGEDGKTPSPQSSGVDTGDAVGRGSVSNSPSRVDVSEVEDRGSVSTPSSPDNNRDTGTGGMLKKILDPGVPLVLVDTGGKMRERSRAGSPSKENPGEASLALDLVNGLLATGLRAGDIGVIAPYKDQKDIIESKVRNEGLEVDTVDGFQGREKEAVVLSLTRSNKRGEVGFLKDLRRLNVSITRAKRKLIVIADVATASTLPTYRRLFDHIKSKGVVVEGW